MFVADTLSDPYDEAEYIPSVLAALGKSRKDANKIKREEAITVVVGNPPFMFASLHPDRPSEAITREQAVIAYTLTSAYAEFAEKDKGGLESGKLADLAVLSQDIFTVDASELPKTESVLAYHIYCGF
jgi:hypothetical protein